MATVHIVCARVKGRANTGSTMPVPDSVPVSAETKTSSGTSSQTTIAAPDLDSFWSVTVTGGNVWVAAGSSPTAASGSGYLVLDGQTRDLAVSAAGEKLAIKDA